MKKIIILLLATILFTACEYDNYDAPSVTFSGQLLYNDKPFLCDGNDARDIFLFFQEGFGSGIIIRIILSGQLVNGRDICDSKPDG